MIAAALVSLALQDSHAPLHPRDTDWFVEIPNVASLVEAYESAPLSRLIADEELQASVTKLMADLDEPIDEALEELSERSGWSREAIENAPGRAVGWLRRVRTVSVSLSGYRPAYDALHDVRAKWLEAERELEILAETVRASLAAGLKPRTLGELDVDPKLRTDPWGRPYDYEPVFEIGDAVVDGLPDDWDAEASQPFGLYCHGPDGVPGSLVAGDGVSMELDGDAPTVERNLELHGRRLARQFGVLVVLELTSTDSAALVHGKLHELAQGHWQSADEAAFASGVVTVDRYAQAEDAPPAWLALDGSHVFVGFAGVDPEAVGRRTSGAAAGLDAAARYTELAGHVATRAGSSGQPVLRGFHELGLLELLFELGLMQVPSEGDEAAAALEAFRTRTAGAFEQRLDGGRFVTTALERRAGEAPLDRLVGAGTVTSAHFELVPSDAVGVLATTVDLAGLWSWVRELVADATGETELGAFDARLEELETEWNLDVVGDLVGSLGRDVTAYLQPLKLGPPNCALVWELADPEALDRFVRALSEATEDLTAGAFTFTMRDYKDVPIWTLRRSSEPLDAGPMTAGIEQAFTQLTPSLVVVDGRAVFTLTSLHAKRTVKRVQDTDRERHALGTTLAVPPGTTSGTYFDGAGLVLDAYTIGRGMLGLMGGFGGGELPFRAADLPDPERIRPYFDASVGWRSRGPEGTWTSSVSSFGPETWAGLAGVSVAGVALSARQVEERVETARHAAARADLLGLEHAARTYSLENGGPWPATLDELVVTGEDGEAPLSEDDLVDPWGHAYRYEPPAEAGRSPRLWSIGPNGLDEDGGGDDVRRE